MLKQKNCPCGSGKDYEECCAPLHGGERMAATAEALMRSRFTAFVMKNADYLASTWHLSTCPDGLDLSNDETRWQRLIIVASEQGNHGDSVGKVEFVAFFDGGQLHERSRFVRDEGRWIYVDGEILPPLAQVGRNEPCLCGSGRKFKKCCGG